jgi:hypothetical protein
MLVRIPSTFKNDQISVSSEPQNIYHIIFKDIPNVASQMDANNKTDANDVTDANSETLPIQDELIKASIEFSPLQHKKSISDVFGTSSTTSNSVKEPSAKNQKALKIT